MQLNTPLSLVADVLRQAGFERGLSIANAKAGMWDDPPMEQLLEMAAGICRRASNPRGHGPVDVVSRYYDIHGRFD